MYGEGLPGDGRDVSELGVDGSICSRRLSRGVTFSWELTKRGRETSLEMD